MKVSFIERETKGLGTPEAHQRKVMDKDPRESQEHFCLHKDNMKILRPDVLLYFHAGSAITCERSSYAREGSGYRRRTACEALSTSAAQRRGWTFIPGTSR